MTVVRLAMGGAALRLARSLAPELGSPPALLVSYAYYEQSFNCIRAQIGYRDWSLDSGAFSVENSGGHVELAAYAEFCTQVLTTDNTLTEIISLDVLGDWRAGLHNTEQLWAMGIPAMPTYHHGEPLDVLHGMARDYPKICLGGAVGMRSRAKLTWALDCMTRIWPKPVHGLGFGSAKAILSIPFHSVDATNWEAGPMRFGNWQAFGGNIDDCRMLARNVRAEVDFNLEVERYARERWSSVLGEVDEMYQEHVRVMALARGSAAA